ncbi:MAG TPA: hypothetical protein VNN72_29485 [Polyangiaceae bacterium]|nr:hypothetical protein [Polyangiaceae bacterium]
MIEISYYTRLEPRPRANDLTGTLTAEVRDPLWLLARQWQIGEFAGEDAGSLALVEYAGRTTKFPRWKLGKTDAEQALTQGAPLETQTLREPFNPDFATQIELFHDFADYLRQEVGSESTTQELLEKFGERAEFKIAKAPEPDVDKLNPFDAATKRFLGVCAGRTLNGVELLNLAKSVAGGGSIPITTTAALIEKIKNALAKLLSRVTAVFGDVGNADPAAWNIRHLEYALHVVGEDPAGAGNVTLRAHPDSDGEFDWFSFDMVDKNASATEEAPIPRAASTIPARVRFPGMAASRFWAFEENTLAIPDILATGTDDLLKLLIADFMFIHSNDWFVLPFEQPVGSLAQLDYLLVHDVFGTVTAVLRADRDETKAGTNRWTMFSNSDLGPGNDGLADYFIVPPTPGVTMQLGSVLEDVRFGRDETANMAFGIEEVTTSAIGEPRTGRQRDADVNAARIVAPPTTGSDFPLRYQIENELPANWVPLLPVLEDPSNPSVVLQRGKAEKTLDGETPGPVTPLSKILLPNFSTTPYFIAEEEIPRSGLQIERVVYRSRWTDGSTHLWVQRRRKIGAGEAQSGLQFDQALPNES